MKFGRRKLICVIIAVVGLSYLFPGPRLIKAGSKLGAGLGGGGVGRTPPTLSSSRVITGSSSGGDGDGDGLFDYPSFPRTPERPTAADRFTSRVHPDSPPGFNTFSRLYFFNGTLYAVVPDRESKEAFPDLKFVLSRSSMTKGDPAPPTDMEMQILTEAEIQPIIPSLESAVVVKGFSMILYEPNTFMHHYYHWWGEIILGAVRAYAGLTLLPNVESPPMEPARWILANIQDASWRDRAGVNGPLMRAGFPDAPIENGEFWQDMISLQRPFVFERAMVVERTAAHRSPLGSIWFKMVSSTMNVTVPTHFWEPLRQRLVRNTVGYLPWSHRHVPRRPQVLYISRQLQEKGRRLSHDAHADLVRALRELEDEGLCDVTVAKMELLSFQEQIRLAANAVVMIGVHGNGLTHQLWMPPSSQSTVMEITFPNTYIHDYPMLSRNMGHKHYAVWNDTTVTFPEGQWYEGINHGERKDTHGSNIPVFGDTVADVIRERLGV